MRPRVVGRPRPLVRLPRRCRVGLVAGRVGPDLQRRGNIGPPPLPLPVKSACHVLFAALLVLLAGCGNLNPADPLAGLSEVEQRAALTHAANHCAMAKVDAPSPRYRALWELQRSIASGIGEAAALLAVRAPLGSKAKISAAGSAIAFARRCVVWAPPDAPVGGP
jgi:hypothetical protein